MDEIQGWEINLRVGSNARECGPRLEVQSEGVIKGWRISACCQRLWDQSNRIPKG